MAFVQSPEQQSGTTVLPVLLQSPGISVNQQSHKRAEQIIGRLAALGIDQRGQSAGCIHALGTLTDAQVSELESVIDADTMQLYRAVHHMTQLADTLAPAHLSPANSTAGNEENLRKMLIIMVDDVRVVVIFLANQLSKLLDMKDRPDEVQQHHARLTLDIYAPLANRLGIGQLKWELEDCAFRCLEFRTYHTLARALQQKRRVREQYIVDLTGRIASLLEGRQIEARIQGRAKHIYSIWRKMQDKGLEFNQLKDILAVRVLVNSVEDCYSALSVIHERWHHDRHEFSDYINRPKANGYQSIHTVISGPDDKTVEVQIRTFDMHEESELGFAAHWRYKETARYDSNFDQKLIWLRQLLQWKDEVLDSSTHSAPTRDSTMQSGIGKTAFTPTRRKQSSRQVYVFTPKGQIIVLPEGATPIDFAYAIHSEVGHRTRGAKVNGKMVSLNYLLQTGDQVNIQTTKSGGPSRDWLRPDQGYIRTSRARKRISQWYKRADYEHNVAEGRATLERDLQRRKREPDTRGRQVRPKPGVEIPAKVSFTVSGVDNLLTHIAKCCVPAPGDDIIGFITSCRGVTIHRKGCNNITAIKPELQDRLIEVEWD